jgi:SAM-dependent methyltransferase
MSSPMVLERRAVPQRAFLGVQPAPHGRRRVDVLADRLAMHVESLVPRGRARCLDVRCGDMTLAEAIQSRAPRSDWRCLDMEGSQREHGREEGSGRYRAFDGRTIPYGELEFDIALLCDVLHHTPEHAARLLAEAGRVAQRVLIKDHFEYGSYSRTMLRLMDFVGNWRYGTSIPDRYFTREAFAQLATEQGFAITALDCGLSLYDHLPVARTMLRSDWDFIAVLRRL